MTAITASQTAWESHVDRAIEAVRQAPYGAQIPGAVVEQMRATLLARPEYFPIPTQMSIGPALAASAEAQEHPAADALRWAGFAPPAAKVAPREYALLFMLNECREYLNAKPGTNGGEPEAQRLVQRINEVCGSSGNGGVTPSPEGFGKLDLTVPDTGEVRRARSVRVPDSSGNGGVIETCAEAQQTGNEGVQR